MTLAFLLFAVLPAYLAGSLPFGLLIARGHGVDLRRAGSGNIGATNVGRVVGRRWGVACFLLDLAKGAVPVLAVGWAMGWAGRFEVAADALWPWLAVAAAAVAGHVFPPWLGFRGGKGAATGLGVLLGFFPLLALPGLAATLTWLLVMAIDRRVGLASVLAAGALPLFVVTEAYFAGLPAHDALPLVAVTAILAGLVIGRHRGNLARIVAGTEPRVNWLGGAAKRSADSP